MLLWALKNWKLVAGIAAILLIISLIGAVSLLRDQLAQTKSDNRNLINLYSAESQKVQHYTSKLGQEVANNKAVVLSNKAMKDLMDNQEMQWLNNFKDLKRSLKNLEVAQRITANAYDSLKVLLEDTTKFYIIPTGDTVKFKAVKMRHRDKYASIRAEQITPDSGVFVYHVEVPIDGAIYWTQKWFLGKKHYESEFTSENPNVTITKLQTIKVTRRRKSKSQ